MEPSLMKTTPSVVDDDEWDTEGFVIPSLGIEDQDYSKTTFVKVEDSKTPKVEAGKEEHIYLGPHGAPPSHAKPQELKNPSSRKHKFKQKLKDADKRCGGTGRENKVDNLRELVGGGKMLVAASKSSSREWLDPHCHESQFERRNH